jgi:sec-independent protein translocase protein TatB
VFNIGPLEFVVLALIGIVVLGPDRLPQFARDAARMIRTLRDMATGAQKQLREELGPEFADLDLRNLNPRTAVQRAVFGDEMPDLRKYSPGNFVRDTIYGEDEPADATDDQPVSMTKRESPSVPMTKPSANGGSANGASANGASANGASATGTSPNRASANGASANGASANGRSTNGARPRPRPRPRTSYDEDAT